jgi:hypothetical protein
MIITMWLVDDGDMVMPVRRVANVSPISDPVAVARSGSGIGDVVVLIFPVERMWMLLCGI